MKHTHVTLYSMYQRYQMDLGFYGIKGHMMIQGHSFIFPNPKKTEKSVVLYCTGFAVFLYSCM